MTATDVSSELAEPLPLERWMMVALAALTATIVASALSIAFDVYRVEVVNRLLTDASAQNVIGFAADTASAHTSDNQTAAAAVFELAAFLVAVVGSLGWFYGAYANLPRLGVHRLRYRKGWAVGAWFIPILSLFRPKQIANDIWRGSDPASPYDWTSEVAPVIHYWWAAFVINGVLGQITLRQWNAAHTLEDARTASVLDVVSGSVSIVAALLACVVVYRVTARQKLRADARLGEASTGQRVSAAAS